MVSAFIFPRKNGFLKKVAVEDVRKFETGLHAYFHEHHQNLIDRMEEEKIISDELGNLLKGAIEEYASETELLG